MDSNLNEKDLYKVFGVTKDATQGDIKKAYYKLAIKLHPDKNPDDEEAKDRFQRLQRVYAVLGDPEKRAVYDQTGSLQDSEELTGEAFNDLYDYYRTMFPTVSEDDIEAFEVEYRGSQEEKRDLLRYYTQFKGDMSKVFEWLICSRPEVDSHRFMDTIQQEIQQGSVKKFKSFTNWAKATEQKPRPKHPLAASKQSKRKRDDSAALVAQIRSRAAGQMDNLVAALEAKYANKENKKKNKKKQADEAQAAEPTDEEFEAARTRLENKSGTTKRTGKEKVKAKR